MGWKGWTSIWINFLIKIIGKCTLHIYTGIHKCNETFRVNLLLFYDNEKLHQTMTICISESLLNETHQDWKCWLTPLLMRCPSKFLAPTIQKKESSLNIFLQTCDRKYDVCARLESSRRYQQWGIIIPNYLVIFLTNNLIDNWPNNYECRNIFIHMYLGGGVPNGHATLYFTFPINAIPHYGRAVKGHYARHIGENKRYSDLIRKMTNHKFVVVSGNVLLKKKQETRVEVRKEMVSSLV